MTEAELADAVTKKRKEIGRAACGRKDLLRRKEQAVADRAYQQAARLRDEADAQSKAIARLRIEYMALCVQLVEATQVSAKEVPPVEFAQRTVAVTVNVPTWLDAITHVRKLLDVGWDALCHDGDRAGECREHFNGVLAGDVQDGMWHSVAAGKEGDRG